MNYILFYFILFILLLAGSYWLFKKLVKTIIIVTIIFTILTAFIGYATYLDVKEFSQRFPSEQNVLLVIDNDHKLTGITFNINKKDDFNVLSEQELNIDELLKTNFKVITLDTKVLEDSLPEEIQINDKTTMPKDKFLKAIRSEDPLSELDLKIIFKDQFELLPEEVTNEQLKEFIESLSSEEFNLKDKSHVRALLLSSSIQSIAQKNPSVLLKEYKTGNLKIYKETITFKIIKSVPNSLINILAQKIPQSL